MWWDLGQSIGEKTWKIEILVVKCKFCIDEWKFGQYFDAKIPKRMHDMLTQKAGIHAIILKWERTSLFFWINAKTYCVWIGTHNWFNDIKYGIVSAVFNNLVYLLKLKFDVSNIFCYITLFLFYTLFPIICPL